MITSDVLLFSAVITIWLYFVVDSIGFWLKLRKLERRIDELKNTEERKRDRELRRRALLDEEKKND